MAAWDDGVDGRMTLFDAWFYSHLLKDRI